MTTTDCLTHTWEPTETGAYVCAYCPEQTGACHTCQRPLLLANLICAKCLDDTRKILASIREAANTPYSYPTLGIKAVRYDGERTSGSRAEDPRGSTPAKVDDRELFEFTGKIGADLVAILRDPPNVLEPLLDIADRWAETRGENAHDTNVFDYLDSRLLWAANQPDQSAWHDFLTEARTIRNRLRRLVGLAPTYHPAPCVHCGGSILQEQTDQGLEDRLRCTGCGTTWQDREHLAVIDARAAALAPVHRPDTLVTVAEARAALPHIRRGTLNVAIHRDRGKPEGERRLPERGTNAHGQTLYRLGDIAELMAPVEPVDVTA